MIAPALRGNPSSIVQAYLPIFHRAEQAFLAAGANGDEIRARTGVIIAGQTNGTAAVDFWVE